MLRAHRILRNPRQLKAVTGVDQVEFSRILETFKLLWNEFLNSRPRERSIGGGRKGVIGSIEDKLLFILFYIKAYPTFDVASFIFGADRTRCCQWVIRLLPILEKTLGRVTEFPKRKLRSIEEFLEAFPEVKDIFIDGTERRVRNSKKYHKQKKNYSGKKKTHTRKNLVACDEKGRILLLSPTDGGRVHDLTCLKKWNICHNIPNQVAIWTDKGFAGLKSLCGNEVMTPHKKPRKSSLAKEKLEENKIISGLRIVVEHAIGGMKRFDCLSQVYRNRKGQDDRMTSIAAGIWNLHLQTRTLA